MSARKLLAIYTLLASGSAWGQGGWITAAYPTVSNLRLNPPVVVTADVRRLVYVAAVTPSVGRADCVYTARIDVAAAIGPQLDTNRVTNSVAYYVPTALCTNATVTACTFCAFGLASANVSTTPAPEAVALQARDAWQWDAWWAIKERADVAQVGLPSSALYRGNYEALIETKQWISNNCTAFRVPSDTNLPPAAWTADGLAAFVGAPASWYTNSPQRGMAEQWQYVRPMLTNLYVTWISGGCATNCAPRDATMGVHSQTITDPLNVCTAMVTWAFASNDTCALPSAALVVTPPTFSDAVYMTWETGNEVADCESATTYNRTLRYHCGQWCQIDPVETCVNQNPSMNTPGQTNVPPDELVAVTNGQQWLSCVGEPGFVYISKYTVTGITNEACGGYSACIARSSNPIGYVLPSTNYASSRVEYLAAGLPSTPCAPTNYQSETVSAALSNGAWVAWSSNTAATLYWCNNDFVTTARPYAATCATNAGWAVTNAGARIIWTGFRYL